MADNLTDTAENLLLDAINGTAGTLVTTPIKLRILSVLGSDSGAGTAYAGTTDQTITFAASSAGSAASSNGQTFTGLGTGDCVGWEIYDTAGTPKRLWWGVWSPKAGTCQDTGDTVTSTAHGYANGQKVVFMAGYTPAGLTAGTVYFVVGQTANTFQVSTTSGGAAAPITADSLATNSIQFGVVKTVANAGDSLAVASGAIVLSLS